MTSKRVTVQRPLQPKVVQIKRSYWCPRCDSNTSVFLSFGSLACSLNLVPSVTDFTNLFDQFRIVKVKYDFFPRLTGNPANGVPGNCSIFHMAVDHTDVTPPSLETDLLQYDQHRTVQAYKPFSITFKPAPAATYWQGVTASGYGPKAGSWIDCSSGGVQHYGLKYCFSNNSATTTSIDIKATLWLEFREAR